MRYKKKQQNKSIKSKSKEEYIMFMDETDPNSVNDYFCLSGMIIKRNEYEDILIKKINELKQKHFNNSDVVFHYTDMKNNKNDFKIFKDATIRNRFYVDFVNILRTSNITIISSYFNKEHMKKSYGKCAVSDYDVAFKSVLENFLQFLVENNGDGMIIMESRLFNENANLQNTFYQYINCGSELFSPYTVKYHLKCLGFLVKNENCIGLQLVDFIPATIIRIIKEQPDKFSMQKVIQSKTYKYGTVCENILGIKNILGVIIKEASSLDT